MQCSQPQNVAFREVEDPKNVHKKRKMVITDVDRDNLNRTENINFIDRRFLYLSKKDCNSIFQTEDWQSSGSVLFIPLTEDVLVNTQNIEQFSSTEGNYFVADENGQYSKTLQGNVLHLWRFCPTKNKLFISRSFLFTNPRDFYEIQQALQKL